MTNPFIRQPEPATPPAVEPVTPIGSQRAIAYCTAALNAATERIANTPRGDTGAEGAGRNNTANATAYSLARLLHTGGLTETDIYTAVREGSIRNGYHAETGDRALNKIIESAIGAGRTKPKHIPDRPREDNFDWINPTTGEIGTGPRPAQPLPPNIDPAVYDAHPWLAHIRQAAHSRTLAADGVLGATLTRASLYIEPNVWLPPIPRYSTPSLYIALVGPSGAGKGSSMDLATELIPARRTKCICGNHEDHQTIPAGTGEGIVKAFHRRVPGGEGQRPEIRHDLRSVCIRIDEGEALANLAGRNGATLATILRQGWSGERLGFAYAAEDKGLVVPALTYRMCVILGIQPTLAGPIFDDAAGGTPQRFLWYSLTDPNIPPIDNTPPWPGPLPPNNPRPALQDIWAAFGDTKGRPIDLDPNIKRGILQRQRARSAGEADTHDLDSHRDLSQLKVAATLAHAAGDGTISGHEWDIAAQLINASDAVREWTRQQVINSETAAAERRVETQARAKARGHELILQRETDATDTAARIIAKHIRRHSKETGEPCRRRCLTHAIGSKRRAWMNAGIAAALDAEWVTETGPGEWFAGAAEVPDE